MASSRAPDDERSRSEIDSPAPRGSPAVRTVGGVAVVGVILLALAVWMPVLYGSASRSTPEPLDDDARDAVASACLSARAELSALTPVRASDPPAVRAARVEAEDEILTSMLTTIEQVPPIDPAGAQALEEWVSDWEGVVAAREEFAASLRAGDPRRPVWPTDDRGRPVTVRMEEYAQIHELPACEPRALQAEIVDGERRYPQ